MTGSAGGIRLHLQKIGVGIVAAVIGGAAVLLLWKPCLPFLAAYLLAGVLQRPYRRLLRLFASKNRRKDDTASPSRRSLYKRGHGGAVAASEVPKLWRGAAAVLPVLICVLAGGGVLWGLGGLLWSEVRRILAWLADNAVLVLDAVRAVSETAASFFAGLPLGGGSSASNFAETVTGVFGGMLTALLSGISAKASSAVGAFAAALPGMLLFFAVFLLASVYMTAEYAAVTAYLAKAIPNTLRRKWDGIRRGVGVAVGAFALAYCKMAALTFGMLLVGLCLLGVRGALTVSLIGALIDLLPLIGVGVLLLPWALFAFFCGRRGLGVGLVVLYLVITVTRRVIEPRLIGRSMGLHPLAALFALYAGGVLFGPLGMIGVPLAASAVLWGYRAVKHGAR